MTVLKSLFPFVLCHWLGERTLVPALASITILWTISMALTLCRIKCAEDRTSTSNMISPVAYQSWLSCTVLLADPLTDGRLKYTMIPRPRPSASLYSLPILPKEAFDFVSKVFSSFSPKMKDLWNSLCQDVSYEFCWELKQWDETQISQHRTETALFKGS